MLFRERLFSLLISIPKLIKGPSLITEWASIGQICSDIRYTPTQENVSMTKQFFSHLKL